MIIKSNYQSTAFVTYVVCLINMRLRKTEHLELSTKMDSKCTHKKDSLHVFWMLRVIYKKKTNRTGGFFKTEPKPNRTWKIHSAHPYRIHMYTAHTYMYTYMYIYTAHICYKSRTAVYSSGEIYCPVVHTTFCKAENYSWHQPKGNMKSEGVITTEVTIDQI